MSKIPSRGNLISGAVHLVVFGSAAVVAQVGGPTLGLPAGTAWVLVLVAFLGLPFAIMLGRSPRGVLAPPTKLGAGRPAAPRSRTSAPSPADAPREAAGKAPAPPTDTPVEDPTSPWGKQPAAARAPLASSTPPSPTVDSGGSTREDRDAHLVDADTSAPVVSRTAFVGDPQSVVVLPFGITGSDPTIEYLAEGIAEEVLLGLGRLRDSKIPARGTTFLFSRSKQSAGEFGRSLGAAHVLTATVARETNALKVDARLLRSADEAEVWRRPIDGTLESVSDMQNELITAVAETVGLEPPEGGRGLTPGRASTVGAAQDHYLRGRHQWHRRGDGLRRAAVLFERSAHADPEFALAHAGRADANMLLGFYGYMEPKSAFQNAVEAAEQALELDEALPEAWTTLGFVRSFFDWDWDRAEVSFKRAVDLNPSYVNARFWYAMSLGVRGRSSDWIRHDLTALKSDPKSVYADAHLGWALLVGARAFEEAEARFRSALDKDPGFSLGYWFLGRAKLHQGDAQSALADLQKGARRSRGNPVTLGTLGYALARSGDSNTAERHLQDLRAGPTGWRWVRASQIATIELGLGQTDDALSSLERALDERDFWLPLTVRRPEWDEVRDDPRFRAILGRLGVAEVSEAECEAALTALSA